MPTTRTRRLAKGKATETDEGDDAEVVPVVEVVSAVKEPWKLPPGVFISFRTCPSLPRGSPHADSWWEYR